MYEDGCLGIAKAVAYSALLSFFPVLTTVALILVRVKANEISNLISRFLFEVVPPGSQELVLRRFTEAGERPASLVAFALAVSLWAGSGLSLSLIDGFNAVYKLPRNRPLLRGRLVAIGLLFACALPAIGASAMIILGNQTETWLATRVGILQQGEQLVGWLFVIGKIARFVIAFGAVTLTMIGLYKIGPARPQRYKYIWPGALIATFLWLASTLIFSWYVRNIADYNLFYGSIGAVIALLLWMYILSLTALYGSAFNAEYERLVSPAERLRP